MGPRGAAAGRVLELVTRGGARVRAPAAAGGLVALPREPAGHPAWTGAKAGVNLEEQQVAKFQSRHQGGLQGLQGFFGKNKS